MRGRVEQGQRAGRVEREVPGAVGDLVADMDQVGRREPARQLGVPMLAELEVAAVEHIRVGDFAGRTADRNAHRIVAHQMLELFAEIVAEQRGAGDAVV